MKNKAHIHNKATTNISRCQHRKINVTSALSRVESELHRAETTAVVRSRRARRKVRRLYNIPVATTTKQLLSSQQLDYCYCRRSSYADIKDETVTTPLEGHRTVPPAHSRSLPFPTPRNVFHRRPDAAPNGNTTLPRTDVFTTFIRPSHEKKTCAHTDN